MSTAIVTAITALSVSGCITGGPRVTNKTPHQLTVKSTPGHAIQSAVLDRDGDTLVVFGNIKHRHEAACRKECYVQLKITSAAGKVLRKIGIPIVHRGTQQRGWFGASFRVKLPFKMPAGASVALTVRDRGCRAGPYFECDPRPRPRPRIRPPAAKKPT